MRGFIGLFLVLRHARSSGMRGYQSCSIATRLGAWLGHDWLGWGTGGGGAIRGGSRLGILGLGRLDGDGGCWLMALLGELQVAVKQMFYHRKGDTR
jgi:hypothetical protein